MEIKEITFRASFNFQTAEIVMSLTNEEMKNKAVIDALQDRAISLAIQMSEKIDKIKKDTPKQNNKTYQKPNSYLNK